MAESKQAPFSKTSTMTVGLALALMAIASTVWMVVSSALDDNSQEIGKLNSCIGVVSRDVSSVKENVSDVKKAVNEMRKELTADRAEASKLHSAIGERLARLETRIEAIEKGK